MVDIDVALRIMTAIVWVWVAYVVLNGDFGMYVRTTVLIVAVWRLTLLAIGSGGATPPLDEYIRGITPVIYTMLGVSLVIAGRRKI